MRITQNELMKIHLERKGSTCLIELTTLPQGTCCYIRWRSKLRAFHGWLYQLLLAEGHFVEQHIRFLGEEPDDLRFGVPEPSRCQYSNFQFKRQTDGFGVFRWKVMVLVALTHR